MADNTAKHVLDTGPTFNCRLPIFALDPGTAKSKIGELEIGRELDYFRANGAKLIEGPKLSFETKAYELEIADSVLKLVERVAIHAHHDSSVARRQNVYSALPALGRSALQSRAVREAGRREDRRGKIALGRESGARAGCLAQRVTVAFVHSRERSGQLFRRITAHD